MDLKEALTVAIDYEHRVRDHYARGAEALFDPRGKKVFETLAREEQGHVSYLESRLGEWQSQGAMWTPPSCPRSCPRSTGCSRHAPGSPAPRRRPSPTRASWTSSSRPSSWSARPAPSTAPWWTRCPLAHKGLFERFLAIEEGHVLIVQAEIDALAGHGFWFDFQEFSLEAG